MNEGNGWCADVITVEKVNLVTNLGNPFNRPLSRMTVDDLLTLMRRKYGPPGGEA
jgi:hypothetical protein